MKKNNKRIMVFMMVLSVLVLLSTSLLLFGAPPSRLWTQAQYNEAVYNCMNNVSDSLSEEFAEIYCTCVLDIASIRYEFDEFAANEDAIVVQFTEDGTIEDCNRRAIEMTSEGEQWTQYQYDDTVKNCVNSFPEGYTVEFAEIYCDCVINVASQRYGYLDFVDHEDEYVNDFIEEGIIDDCVEYATEITQ